MLRRTFFNVCIDFSIRILVYFVDFSIENISFSIDFSNIIITPLRILPRSCSGFRRLVAFYRDTIRIYQEFFRI